MKQKRKLFRLQVIKAAQQICEYTDGKIKVNELARCLEIHRSTLNEFYMDKFAYAQKSLLIRLEWKSYKVILQKGKRPLLNPFQIK